MDAEVVVYESYSFDDVEQALEVASFFEKHEHSQPNHITGTFFFRNLNNDEIEDLKNIVGERAKVKEIPSVFDHWETWD